MAGEVGLFGGPHWYKSVPDLSGWYTESHHIYAPHTGDEQNMYFPMTVSLVQHFRLGMYTHLSAQRGAGEQFWVTR